MCGHVSDRNIQYKNNIILYVKDIYINGKITTNHTHLKVIKLREKLKYIKKIKVLKKN